LLLVVTAIAPSVTKLKLLAPIRAVKLVFYGIITVLVEVDGVIVMLTLAKADLNDRGI
jgi:hypothetical protein